MIARLRQETVERLAELAAFRTALDTRQVQLRRSMLPAVRVYTSASATNLSANVNQFRTMTSLIVQIIAEDTNDAANAELVDTLCAAAKSRLLCDPSWLGLIERVLSVETVLDYNAEGESRTVIATLTFSLQDSELYEPVIPDWLESVRLRVDVISPAADPNIRFPGPDGRIEIAGVARFPPQPEPEA
jgi:hypothetical protein